MLAIYKKELKSYFHSMIGYVFMAFFLVVIGIYMYAVNFVYQVANFEVVLQNVSFIFIILVPILTMRVIAEEKKQKTDQLLFTSAVSMPKIVLAKYLAVISLFAITILVVCFYPIVLSIFGKVAFGTCYTAIFGFFLMGAALIAVGLFISSLTESQIIAAVISFIVLLLSFLANQLSNVLPTEKLPTMIITLLIFAVFSFVIYISLRKIYVAIGTWLVGTVALILLYVFHGSFYDNLLAKLVNGIALMKPFDNFVYGMVYFADIIYYLSVIALFVTFTTLFIKDGLSDKMRRGSTYRTGLMLLTAIICVVLNLFAGKLNAFVDVSTQKMYSITQDTIDFVKGIDNKITIYNICEEGKEEPTIETIVNKYKNLNSKVKVVKKDPVLYPNFTKKYTNDDIIYGIIVVNEDNDKFRIVNYGDMYQYDQNGQVSGVDVEGQITSAIDFVTSKNLPVLYYTTGHGETELGTGLKSIAEKKNVTVNSLATVTVEKIPEDCDIIVVNGATSDFSKEEVSMLRVFLANGGKAIITLAQTNEKMSNLTGLLEYYGIYQKEGIVVEQYGSYMSGSPANIIPELQAHSIVNKVRESGKYVVMPNSVGIMASDTTRKSVTLTELMKTTDGAYSKVNADSKTAEFEDGDIIGPFSLAILAEEKSEAKKDQTMKLVVYSSAYLLNEEIVGTGQFANGDVFGDTLSYLSPDGSNVSISSINLSTEYLTISPNAQIILGIVFIFVLPLAILITGLIIWLRRRKA